MELIIVNTEVLLKLSEIKNKELSTLLIGRKGGITTIKITDMILHKPRDRKSVV